MLFLLFLFIIPFSFYGQTFSNKIGEQVATDWVFNSEYIQTKRIKRITGRFTIKLKGVPMKETNYWQVFDFDSLGRILRSYETRKDDGTKDTVWTNYFYNDKGLLIYKSVGDKEKLTYWTTVYDSEKRITAKEEFERKKDRKGTMRTVEKGKEFNTYETDGKMIKTLINDFGIPFSKETYYYDANGKIIRTENHVISTDDEMISHFIYDHNGNLILKKTEISKQGIEQEKIQFSYDISGNLIAKKVLLGDKLIQETQFIYNDQTGYLSAILMEEDSSSNILILRIKEYQYY